MTDISGGRFWDLPWSLVDGCTPCSPGCDHCWSAAMTHRFNFQWTTHDRFNSAPVKFNGKITIHPEKISIPMKRRKPTVFSIWNDWAHPGVTRDYRVRMVDMADACPRHTILALTKRESVALDFWQGEKEPPPINWWSGLTVCNQPEADEKIPIFLQVPGKKFLSIEPMLGAVNIAPYLGNQFLWHGKPDGVMGVSVRRIDAVILGGETGPGARPMHPDWVRSVRDQCAAVWVPFFFKSWGSATFFSQPDYLHRTEHRVKLSGRLLDGRTHDDLPWSKL